MAEHSVPYAGMRSGYVPPGRLAVGDSGGEQPVDDASIPLGRSVGSSGSQDRRDGLIAGMLLGIAGPQFPIDYAGPATDRDNWITGDDD